MPAVVTDIGLAAFAAAARSEDSVTIDSIQIGSGITRYDATADRTALVDATPTVYDDSSLEVVGSSTATVFSINLEDNRAFILDEVGFFSGSDLILLWADVGAAITTKTQNSTVLLALRVDFVNGSPTTATLTIVYPGAATSGQVTAGAGTGLTNVTQVRAMIAAFAEIDFASNSEALAGRETDKAMSPATTKLVINDLVPPASTSDVGKVKLATSSQRRSVQRGVDPISSVQNNVLTLQSLYDTWKIYEQVPTVTNNRQGRGAVIKYMTLGGIGQITNIVWENRGLAYNTGDILTFTQGDTTATYTLVAADFNFGALNDFNFKSIGTGFRDTLPETVPSDGTIELVYLSDPST